LIAHSNFFPKNFTTNKNKGRFLSQIIIIDKQLAKCKNYKSYAQYEISLVTYFLA